MLPFNLPELEVSGLALVTAIDDCPPIADGEGSVVTARFVTREVHVVASVDVLGADGSVETITGTTIHPVWSVDRQEWVPLAELAQGERLYCDTESFGLGFPSSLSPKASGLVLSVSLSRVSQPVYNIEVHGEHVYQVGELGVVVHNACEGVYEFVTTAGEIYIGQSKNIARRLKQHIKSGKLDQLQAVTVQVVEGGKTARELVELGRINALGGIDNLANKVLPISNARLEAILKLGGG
jgi:hypothetical protein